MDYLALISEMNRKTDKELAEYAKVHQIPLSKKEIQKLRPLLSKFSFQWVLTGIPDKVLREVEEILGKKKTKELLGKYAKYL
ncbi:DUF2624 family protein [Rummeliibacillus stabekisii]|uniref:Endonuclease IV n=1 Tax=Rummeliibacillus stabekisii TaxID=241244 RepID=A0A143HAQ7_9BACL|nr:MULTISPECIES: DUF2624 family protein [Rummeliibacillus]AMW98792.1 hypothetical protein ATY39_04615 [Rummeliibacillus stabekisii]MCM3316139.1 DUF2624 family protein [Rummeliibacillus stabekisii]